MKTPREKYQQDNHYKALVDVMVAHIDACNYTPSEMREAAILASIIYEENRIMRSEIFVPAGRIRNSLATLEEWLDEEASISS